MGVVAACVVEAACVADAAPLVVVGVARGVAVAGAGRARGTNDGKVVAVDAGAVVSGPGVGVAVPSVDVAVAAADVLVAGAEAELGLEDEPELTDELGPVKVRMSVPSELLLASRPAVRCECRPYWTKAVPGVGVPLGVQFRPDAMFAADNVASDEFVSGDSPVIMPIAPIPTATTPTTAARASLSSRPYDGVRCLPSMTLCLGPRAPCSPTALMDNSSTVPCRLALARCLRVVVAALCLPSVALCLPDVALYLAGIALCLPGIALCLPAGSCCAE